MKRQSSIIPTGEASDHFVNLINTSAHPILRNTHQMMVLSGMTDPLGMTKIPSRM
jgi:hypothetical protein